MLFRSEDGYTLIGEVRAGALEGCRELTAVALTGYAGLEHERRALAAGFDEHVPKPVDLARLRALIERLLARPPA